MRKAEEFGVRDIGLKQYFSSRNRWPKGQSNIQNIVTNA